VFVKEQGAVQQGIDLLRMALRDRPFSSSYAVNLAHALELLQDLAGVVGEVTGFLHRLVQQGGASCAALGDMPLDIQVRMGRQVQRGEMGRHVSWTAVLYCTVLLCAVLCPFCVVALTLPLVCIGCGRAVPVFFARHLDHGTLALAQHHT
jgi:hypothetical protein